MLERLNQSSEKIKESKRAILETEEIGVSILQDLHQPRQTLLHAQDKVQRYIVFLLCYSLNGDIVSG